MLAALLLRIVCALPVLTEGGKGLLRTDSATYIEPALALLKENRVVLPEPEWHALEDYEAAFASRAFKAGFVIGE